MNPLSLLTKGRTIRGLKERPGAYKLLEKSILPNFSGAKSASPTISHEGLFKEEGRRKKEESRESTQPAAPEQQPNEAQTPAATDAPQEQPPKPGPLNRLASWARQRLPLGKEKPFQTPAVQTELALDKVKVIRNDLSEDDLEVVAIDKKKARREDVEREKATAET